MRLSIVCLVALFAIFSIQTTSAVHPLKHKVVGGALVGKALLGKALLLKKPKLIIGGLVAGKLAKKALVVGAGSLAGHKLLGGHRPCATRSTSFSSFSRSFESSSYQKTIAHRIEKRSPVYRAMENLYKKNATLNTVYPIRRGARNLTAGLVRRRRATMTVEQLLKYVKDRNGEVCLQQIICQLSAYNYHYQDEGVRFGTRLLAYENIANPEAAKYKAAQKLGLQFRVRGPVEGPRACARRYSRCQYDPRAVISDGNAKLN